MTAPTALFKPLTVGSVALANRFVMAPLTRCRAKIPGHVPTPLMAEYYEQRASAGLIVAEATMVQEGHCAFYMEPGIYSAEQVEAWKATTAAVHAKGGKIFLQIWHGGRVTHSINDGQKPIGPSAITVSHTLGAAFNPTGEAVPYEAPRALEDAEIPSIIALFVKAAENAIAAGFDGVEVHGANGYLLDQFWRDGSNKRDAPYGGSLEGRAKFVLDVVAAVSAAIGAGKVGIRISPLNSYNDMVDSQPEAMTRHLCKELSKIGIAYVHIMRADFFGVQKGDAVTWVRESFNGTVIANMGYEIAEAEAAIASGKVDAIAFGTKFLANPDLPARALAGHALQNPDPNTFYTHDAAGFTDYPTMA